MRSSETELCSRFRQSSNISWPPPPKRSWRPCSIIHGRLFLSVLPSKKWGTHSPQHKLRSTIRPRVDLPKARWCRKNPKPWTCASTGSGVGKHNDTSSFYGVEENLIAQTTTRNIIPLPIIERREVNISLSTCTNKIGYTELCQEFSDD